MVLVCLDLATNPLPSPVPQAKGDGCPLGRTGGVTYLRNRLITRSRTCVTSGTRRSVATPR